MNNNFKVNKVDVCHRSAYIIASADGCKSALTGNLRDHGSEIFYNLGMLLVFRHISWQEFAQQSIHRFPVQLSTKSENEYLQSMKKLTKNNNTIELKIYVENSYEKNHKEG